MEYLKFLVEEKNVEKICIPFYLFTCYKNKMLKNSIQFHAFYKYHVKHKIVCIKIASNNALI